MNKIQVTTVRIDSAAQVILPNTYFVTKAVKAMVANDQLRDLLAEKTELPIKNELETIGTFLHELIDALEGD